MSDDERVDSRVVAALVGAFVLAAAGLAAIVHVFWWIFSGVWFLEQTAEF